MFKTAALYFSAIKWMIAPLRSENKKGALLKSKVPKKLLYTTEN